MKKENYCHLGMKLRPFCHGPYTLPPQSVSEIEETVPVTLPILLAVLVKQIFYCDLLSTDSAKNLGNYTLQLYAVLNESGNNMFGGRELPSHKIKFSVNGNFDFYKSTEISGFYCFKQSGVILVV